MGFVLYGGTAIALRLGHRQSVDFDFFTERPFDHDQLVLRLPALGDALVLQSLPDTFTLSLDAPGKGLAPVRVSFSRVGTGRIHDPEWTTDGNLLVAVMGTDPLKEALLGAEPGWFSERSWAYWCYRLGFTHPGDPLPGMPQRVLPEE